MSGFVAATATDAATQDTSEFSPAIAVSAGPALLRAPVITSFSPYKVAPGGVVTINGVSLATTRAVKIGASEVAFKVLSANQVQLTAPNGYFNAPIVLTTDAGVATSPTNLVVASPNDNDFFVFAKPLIGSSGSLDNGTGDATREPGEPVHGGVGSGRSRWFRWTTPTDGQATVQVRGDFLDSVLAVYIGTRIDRLQLVAANDDASTSFGSGSRVTFSAQAGQTYHIAVDSARDTFGFFKLEWQLSQPPLRVHAGSIPALSAARADAATQSIRLTFTRPLATVVASEWTVEVNGRAEAVESIAVVGNRLMLGLPEGVLQRGDRVGVRYRNRLIATVTAAG